MVDNTSKAAGLDNLSLFPIWLMRSKVHPTHQRVDMLERPGLIRKLDRCIDATLSLIHAPAGYGKSTLYTAWRHKLRNNQVKVCWLSLDGEDNELFQLLTYIAFSLAEGGADFGEIGITDNARFGDLSHRNFLSIINRVIEVQKEKVVLILDDFENLGEEAIENVIQPLLEYAPDNLHVAIASRDDSKLKIARLETKGLVARIPAEEMRFSLTELKALFADALPVEVVQRIYDLTEGWPVTVQMFRNSISEQADVEHLLARFNDSSGVITTYLSEQIFGNLNADMRMFLMDISLLDRVSCEFANYLREREDSLSWFAAGKPLNTLVLPLEGVEHTYRLHPLFREYLYQRLRIDQPERAINLHLRTAEWFTVKGNIVMAVKHAVQGQQPARAANIIERAGGGMVIWLSEGLTRLRAVLKLLDERTILDSPRLTLIRCLIEIKDGRVYQARQDYEATLTLYRAQKAALSVMERERIDHELMLLESVLACYEGKMLSEQFCLRLSRNIGKIAADKHATLGHHYSVLCFANVQRGRFEQAREHARQALAEFKSLGSVYGELYIYFHLGDICFAEGRSEQAQNHYQAALRLARQHFNDDKGIKLIANVLTAELKYELNRTQGLAQLLASIPRQLEKREAWFDVYAAGYLTASNIEFQLYGLESATALLEQAYEYAKAQKLTRLTNLLTFQRIDLLLRAEQDYQAQRVLARSGLQLTTYKNPDNSEIAWRECHAAVYAMTWLQIRQGRCDEALSVLEHFSEHARSYGHIKSCIRYEILKMLACRGRQNDRRAFSHLEQALLWSSRSGFVRSFIDAGADVKGSLRQYLKSPQAKASAAHRQQAQAILDGFVGANPDAGKGPLLSKRESEVLQHLIHGESNKVIARNIDVSENTVRFHLKNIFAKLHVSSRLQAVTVARREKLLDSTEHR